MGSVRNGQKRLGEKYHPHSGVFKIFLIEIIAIKPYLEEAALRGTLNSLPCEIELPHGVQVKELRDPTVHHLFGKAEVWKRR